MGVDRLVGADARRSRCSTAATLAPVTPPPVPADASSDQDATASGAAITSTTSLEASRDGLTRLQRHWAAVDPTAAIVLVHGIGEHSGRYEHVGAHLAARGFDVLAFDNRGFGQSGGKRAHVDSFDQYLDDIEDVLEIQRGLGVPTVLIGHSLGGLMVATYLESGRPQPDFGVLSAPAIAATVPGWQRRLAPVLGKILPTAFVKSKIDAELLSRDVSVQQAYLDDPLVFGGATAGMGAIIFDTMESTSKNLASISVPVYCLHGSEDHLVPLAASDGLAALPNVERRVWDGLRHECMNEPEQDQVLTELSDWIAAQLAMS